MKDVLSQASKPSSSNKVILLSGQFNPPTNEHLAMVVALAKRHKGDIWLAPEVPQQKMKSHVKAMCTIFCAEAKASGKADVTCCTAGIDKDMTAVEIEKWCKRTFPNKTFELAMRMVNMYSSNVPANYILYRKSLSWGPTCGIYDETVKYDSIDLEDIVKSIKAGHDESRNIFPNVWQYIQKHKLYR